MDRQKQSKKEEKNPMIQEKNESMIKGYMIFYRIKEFVSIKGEQRDGGSAKRENAAGTVTWRIPYGRLLGMVRERGEGRGRKVPYVCIQMAKSISHASGMAAGI